MRIAVVIAIVILLTACVEPGQYTADPQMDAIVAGATQTAATQRINATATTYQATQQAVFYQVTQEAIATRTAHEATVQAAQAFQTATAVQIASATAVAATATTQHQMEIDALIGEETRIALIALGTRQAIESAATATAVQRDSDDDLLRRERRNTWLGVAVGGVTIIGLILLAVWVWRIAKGAQPHFNDSGQLVALERPFGGLEVIPVRQAVLPATVIEGDPQPPINNLPRHAAPREIPMTVNGQRTTVAVEQDDDVRPETWRTLAIALLVHCANFSRSGVREHAAKPGWRWGDISQPEYNKAFQFMEKNGYLRPGKGTENTLTDRGYDWLARWVPNSLELTAPYPEFLAQNQLNGN